MCNDEYMEATTTATKFDTIEALANEAGWTNQVDHEALMSSVNRMWNRGVITDAVQTLADEYRAKKGLAPAAECTRRISYQHPEYTGISFHVELLDGKIHSAQLVEFSKSVTSLTGMIRYLGTEIEMNQIKERIS